MILSYSFPHFEQLILSGQKKHTFRRDEKKRWKVGMSIQHWMGSPRNKSKNPRFFMDDVCADVEDVILTVREGILYLKYTQYENTTGQVPSIVLHARPVPLRMAQDDGFETLEEMRDYFCPNGEPWEGRIIYYEKCRTQ